MSEQAPKTEEMRSPLSKLTDVLETWNDDSGSTRHEIGKTDIDELLEAYRGNREYLDEIIFRSKLLESADEGRFFSFLAEAARRIRWGDGGNALLGVIWARVYERSSEQTRERLLSGLVDDLDFFAPLYCVPEFVRETDLPAERLSKWFIQIRHRLGNDMATGGLWGGIQALANSHPGSALEVLQHWTERRPTDEVIGMAASLLGKLRSKHADVTILIDNHLSENQDGRIRAIYYRSWAFYDEDHAISFEVYKKLLEQMTLGGPEEISEGLHFVRCTLAAKHRCDDSFQFGLQWLDTNAPTHSDGAWAHWIIHLARLSDERACSLHMAPCRDLIPQLLPIPVGHEGTWRELEALLAKLILEDRNAFEELLFEVARRDAKGLAAKFSSHGEFHELPNLMRQNASTSTIVRALDSLDQSVRQLGISLYCYLGLEQLPPEVLEKWSDDWIVGLVCQVKMESSMDSDGLRFLKAFTGRVDQGSDNLKNFFMEELIWQMKNLPGACLEPTKVETENLSPDCLIRRAVAAAEQYFEKLKPCYRSAINSMEVAGYRRANRLEIRKRSRQVSKSAERSSPLLSMISKSYTLYGGTQWQTYMGGCLTPPSTMQAFSHSVEFPRMLVLDPDGNAQRHRNAAHLMKEVVAAEAGRRAGSHGS